MFHLKNINVILAEKNILSIQELDISDGQKVAVFGPSGCGKTTLLHVMAGLRRVTSGQVLYGEDTDIQKLVPKECDRFRGRNFGFVLQNFHLIKHLTVFENLELAQMAAGIPKDCDKINDLLLRLKIDEKSNERVSSLSHGQAQRAAIARALVNDPQVIFADEPTSALDDQNADAVISLLQEQANATNASLIVATHDQRLQDHFDHLIFLENGKIVNEHG